MPLAGHLLFCYFFLSFFGFFTFFCWRLLPFAIYLKLLLGFNYNSNQMSFVVYILECADKTLYVGSTSDLLRRLHEHNHKKSGAHYTKIRRPVVLKYKEEVPTLKSARAREAELKRLKRIEKLALFTAKHARTKAL